MFKILRFFIFLGTTGFGGPLSLVQLMREHYVDKEKLISQDEFDQVFTMIKAMPGPVAFQMAVFLGQKFHRFPGALLAGLGLLLPPFIMILLMGYFYETLIQFTYVKHALQGFLYAVSAIILFSLRSMVISGAKEFLFWVVMALVIVITWTTNFPEPLLIIGFGLIVVFAKKNQSRPNAIFSLGLFLVDYERLWPLFKFCWYAGTFVFGTGLAILPVLRGQFVDHYAWLTLQEFNDGVIFGQMTPGPVTITATFLGFRAAGFWGALLATFGIFLMPFIHMVTWFPLAVRWLGRQTWIKNFLLGATAAVIGSIVVTVVRMNFSSFGSVLFWIVFLGTFGLLWVRPKTPLLLLIGAGGLLNLAVALATANAV